MLKIKIPEPQEGLNCMQEIYSSNHPVVTLMWACCKTNLLSILNLIFVSNVFEVGSRIGLWEANMKV